MQKPVAEISDLNLKSRPTRVSGDKISSQSSSLQRRIRRYFYLFSLFLFVIVPVSGSAYYFGIVASDRYVAGAGFSVRGVNSGGGIDGIGILTGLPSSGSTTSDSHIILQYLKSRNLVESVQAELDIKTMFSMESIDVLSRLPEDSKIEDLVSYWQGLVGANFDSISGVVSFEVEAFSPEDAYAIADLILRNSKNLINDLSLSARQETVEFAEAEVARSEQRVRESLAAIRKFREQESSINPAASAQLDMELNSSLEGRLVDLRMRISALEDNVDPDAPSLESLRRQAEILDAQIKARTSGNSFETSNGSKGSAITSQIEVYEVLELEKEFAQQAYASARASLEAARVEADRKQRYLAVYSQPAVPQKALYPRRVVNVILIAILATCFWGIGTLSVLAVRDHLS